MVIDEPELKEIEILRLGRHTASNGVSQEFTHEMAQEIVDTYSPDLFKAPLIISHNTGGHGDRDIVNTELAFGTPKYLKKAGDRVKAVFEKISPQFTEWVRNHQILGISPSFYPPNHSGNPTPGKWHLRHIAGLGKNPPAIKGMAALSLSEFLHLDDAVAISFNEFNLESENTLTLNYSEGLMPEDKDKTIDFAERERQLQARETELVKQAQALASRASELNRKEDLDFAEGLIKEGRALPHEKDKLVNFMSCLRSNGETVDFGENDKPTLLEGFRRILTDRPPVIALKEIATPEDSERASGLNFSSPEGFEVDAEALEIHEKAMSYMEQHKVDYLTAIKKVGG